MAEPPTLPRSTKRGDPVWSVLFRLETGSYIPHLVGQVQRVTSEGVYVAGKLYGWSECPLGTEEAIKRYCREHRPEVPGVSGLVSRS